MDKKLLRWNFIFQYGWVLTNILNSILLLPLYLKFIDIDTLGVWLVTGSVLGWMTLTDPGVGEVLQQKIAELRGAQKEGEVGRTIGSGFVASFVILLLSTAIGIACYFFIDDIIKKDIHQYYLLAPAILISIVATGLSLFSFSMSGINQGLHNSSQVAICSLTANFLFLFVNLVFLFLGFGVLSIAIANLARAIYINIYNVISMFKVLRKNDCQVVFEGAHFKKFIRIFSFTSLSKIITGLSYSVDMIVLGRYISPAMITMYEINKRPVNISYSLIGRHSVALMPLVSHAKGQGNKDSIIQLVRRQFTFYCYAAIFVSILFYFNYEQLITAWTGEGKYVGDRIILLLITGFFLNLVSYFMSTIGYALGDIRMNSLYNIIRNIFFGIITFFAASRYGIEGTIIVSILFAFCCDLVFYSWRLIRLGYLPAVMIWESLQSWAIVAPLAFFCGWISHLAIMQILPEKMHFIKLVLSSGIYSGLFMLVLLATDTKIRHSFRMIANRYLLVPLSKLKRA